MTDYVKIAFDKAEKLAKKKKVDDDLDLLPKAVATFLRVCSAQGVIDNGGYRAFFQSDWPLQPSYNAFIEAYSEIGCKRQSQKLEQVVLSFPFPDPHLKSEDRNKYMDENYDKKNYQVNGWDDGLCGDEEVWDKLSEFYLKNKHDFAQKTTSLDRAGACLDWMISLFKRFRS